MAQPATQRTPPLPSPPSTSPTPSRFPQPRFPSNRPFQPSQRFVSPFQREVDSRLPDPTRSPTTAVSPEHLARWNAIQASRRRSVFSESIEPSATPLAQIPYFDKTPQQIQRIREAIRENFLFKRLDPEQEHAVFGAFKEFKKAQGEVVIKQGERGDYFYIVEQGTLEIFVDPSIPSPFGGAPPPPPPSASAQGKTTDDVYSPDGYGKRVEVCRPGSAFGELALMHNTPRAATVVCTTACTLWGLDRLTFRTILLDIALQKRAAYERFLSTVPLLEGLSAYEREKIADVLEKMTYKPGEAVVRQGESGDRFFIVEAGEALVTKNVDGVEKVVNRLGRGQYFGELALLNDQPRAATVVAAPGVDLRVVSMTRPAFERVMGPVKAIMKRKETEYRNDAIEESKLE